MGGYLMSTCRYAESGFYISASGRVSPCCSINRGEYTNYFTSVDQFNTDPHIVEIRKLNEQGKVLEHPACIRNCLEREKRGTVSIRQRSFKNISEGTTGKIKRLDIAFGNTCNLDCVMCRPDFSSKWNITLREMPDSIKTKTNRPIIPNTVMSYEVIDEILESQGSTLESVVIKGGEPLYDKHACYFLEKLIDINPNITIDITSNCTVINYDLLSKFRKINITASIDGIFKIYEYVRGIDFGTVDSNIKKLSQMPNIGLGMNFAASIFNFHTVKETLDYFKNNSSMTWFQVEMVREEWMSPWLIPEQEFYEICNTTEYTADWKWRQPKPQDYRLYEQYKEFWNKQRGMKWEDL